MPKHDYTKDDIRQMAKDECSILRLMMDLFGTTRMLKYQFLNWKNYSTTS